MYECRCDKRLKFRVEESTRLACTQLVGELEHLKTETRLIDEMFASEMGEWALYSKKGHEKDFFFIGSLRECWLRRWGDNRTFRWGRNLKACTPTFRCASMRAYCLHGLTSRSTAVPAAPEDVGQQRHHCDALQRILAEQVIQGHQGSEVWDDVLHGWLRLIWSCASLFSRDFQHKSLAA